MALKVYKCPRCNYIRETVRNKIPKCNHGQEEEGEPVPLIEMEEIITAPNQKFMVTANPGTRTSKLKDSEQILKARARNHSRDVLGDDNIQINSSNDLKESVHRNLLNNKGEKRKKIDDI